MSQEQFVEAVFNRAASQYSDLFQQLLNAIKQGPSPKQYYVQPVQITRNQYIEANCNAVMFFNIGTSNANLNGIVLAPGIGFSIPANLGEMDVTKWQVQFDSPTGNNLLVVRKNYV